MKKFKVAYFGISHPHINFLYDAMLQYSDMVEFIGFADIPADEQTYDDRMGELNAKLNEDFGSDKMPRYENWRELLDQKPDIAFVLADNRSCAEVSYAALCSGIAVVNEKPMAMSFEDAKRLYAASKEHNAPMITNWPIAWFEAFRKAKELADSGKVGRIMRVVYRSPATWGPYSYGETEKPNEEMALAWWYRHELGGGSILDYACYGTILASWFLGKRAIRVSAISKQFTTASFSDVEDYSAMILDFGDAVGLLEGSWSTFNVGQVATGPIIYGTEGTIVCDRHSSVVKVYLGASHTPTEPAEIYETNGVGPNSLLAKNILEFLEGKAPLDDMLSLDLNMDVVAALDAGIRSVEQGRFVEVEQDNK